MDLRSLYIFFHSLQPGLLTNTSILEMSMFINYNFFSSFEAGAQFPALNECKIEASNSEELLKTHVASL